MINLLTAAQMRAIELAAIESGDVTGLTLMERAGRGVVEAIFEEWPDLKHSSYRAVVLCGPGNNGGDGFVVARLLKEWGWEVEVYLYGDAENLPPDARRNYDRWCALGNVAPVSRDMRRWNGAYWDDRDVALVIDALFGTGLTRPIEGALSDLIAALCLYEFATGGARRVAVDIPSGLDSDSGRVLGAAIDADLTVTFHSMKLGHALSDGPGLCRRTVVKDIGIKPGTGAFAPKFTEGEGAGWTVGGAAARPAQDRIWPVAFVGEGCGSLLGKKQGNKFSHGHALVLSGPSGKGGAARLAARGALRIGAGLVTVGCPPGALAENAAQLNAIMLTPVHDAQALARVLEDTRINALCLGPGLGVNEDSAHLVAGVLESRRKTVLDADALTLIAASPALFGMLHENCVMTPHAGEFARLFPDLADRLNAPPVKGPAYSKVEATRAAAKHAGCVVLFKGADTVIGAPNGQCALHAAAYGRAAPWLATAGSGDVLAGFITGLMARGQAPVLAAQTAAWAHVECALSFGPGLIAEDLAEQLPALLRQSAP